MNPSAVEKCEACLAEMNPASRFLNAIIAVMAMVLLAQGAQSMRKQSAPPPAPPAAPPVVVVRQPPPPPLPKPEQTEFMVDEVVPAIQYAGKHLRTVTDGALVMPLLDENGKTTAIGTTLSVLGMYQATYMPHRRLHVGVATTVWQFAGRGYFDPGAKPTELEKARIARVLTTPTIATGTFKRVKDEYAVELTFSGPKGTKKSSTSVPADRIEKLVSWMATEIHAALGNTLSPDEQKVIARADGLDTGMIERLAQVKCGSIRSVSLTSFDTLLAKSPAPDFVLGCALSVAEKGPQLDALLERARVQSGGHPFVDLARAAAASATKNVLLSIQLELGLLSSEFAERELYALMDQDFWVSNRQEELEGIYQFWNRNDKRTYVPLLFEGAFLVRWGWKDRAAGKDPGQAGLMAAAQRHFERAQESLKAAWEKEQHDLTVPLTMLYSTCALGQCRKDMETWYERGRAIDPTSYALAKAKLSFLMPGWHGSEQEMFEFARACAKDAPAGAPSAQVLFDAHKDASERALKRGDTNRNAYFKPPVYRELSGVLTTLDAAAPRRLDVANRIAATAFWSQDYPAAAKQFRRIGNLWDPEVWKDQDEFERARTAAFAASSETSGAEESAWRSRGEPHGFLFLFAEF